MAHYHDLIQDLRQPTRDLRDAIPEVWSGFAEMHKHAVADGALPSKVKELMALAIAVHAECDGCIAYHARAAALRGATVEEAAEALASLCSWEEARRRCTPPAHLRPSRSSPRGEKPGCRHLTTARPRLPFPAHAYRVSG